MKTKRELLAEKNEKNKQIKRVNSEVQTMEGKISRLKNIKKRIDDERDCVRTLRNGVENIYSEFWDDSSWKGKKKNEVGNCIEDNVYSDYAHLYSNIDEIYDALADEITRLENEIYERQGIIGKLKAAVNSIGNEIDKLFDF